MRSVDVAIIGAGTAGLSARREVAKVTDSYVVVDPGELGTTCARVGCMPSKVLIQVANDFHRRHALAEMGIGGGERLVVDTRAVMRHVRKLRDRFVRAVVGDMASWEPSAKLGGAGFCREATPARGAGRPRKRPFRASEASGSDRQRRREATRERSFSDRSWTDTHLVRERARFVGLNTLVLGDGSERIQAERVIIATGSSPIVPAAWRPFQHRLIDTNGFFELEDLPKRVAVIGLGVIGLELGHALARLASRSPGSRWTRRSAGSRTPSCRRTPTRPSPRSCRSTSPRCGPWPRRAVTSSCTSPTAPGWPWTPPS